MTESESLNSYFSVCKHPKDNPLLATVEIILYRLLRWLTGGSYLEIRLSAGISKAAFYNYIYKCMDAIWTPKLWPISF